MSDPWRSIKVREFEHILASPRVALLRVTGKAPRRSSAEAPRPVLLVDDGQGVRRFVSIPSPPDARGLLRAAYSVSADLLTPDTIYSLELVDGSAVALPSPTPGRARFAPDSDADAESESEPSAPVPRAEDERRSGLVSKLAELSAALAETEHARGQMEAASIAARTEATQSREQIQALQARLSEVETLAQRVDERAAASEAENPSATVQELETWSGELERRLTATTDELQELKVGRRDDEAELLRLGDELSQAKAEVELAQAQVSALSDQVRIGSSEPTADDGGELERLAAEVESLRAANVGAEARRARLDQLHSERNELAAQAAELSWLLVGTEQLSALAEALSQARAHADNLHALAGPPPPLNELVDPEPQAGDGGHAASEEIIGLRLQLAQAQAGAAEAQVEAIRYAAEAEARELAERELAQAADVLA